MPGINQAPLLAIIYILSRLSSFVWGGKIGYAIYILGLHLFVFVMTVGRNYKHNYLCFINRIDKSMLFTNLS